MKIVRFGVIGMGNMGSAYAGMFRDGKVPGAELAAVCDTDPTRLAAWAPAAGFARHRELIRSRAVDAVVVCTPHYDHAPVGIDALRAGLHVVVDKPVAPTKRLAEKLMGVPLREGQVFAAMFNQRTDPRYLRIREIIRSGQLGRIQRINWIITDWFRSEAYYASGGWRATWRGEGGGVLLNQSPHQLDLWQWLFGMPARVRAFCGFGRYHRIEVEDDVTAYLEYADGASGVFITTTGEAPGTNRLEIAGDGGKIVVEGSGVRFTRNRVGTREFSRTTKRSFDAPEHDVVEVESPDRGAQHLGILQNAVEAIRGEAELIAPAREGLHSVELANAMLLSGLTGKTVELPMSGAAYDRALRRLIATSTLVKDVREPVAPDDAGVSRSFHGAKGAGS